MVRFWGVFIRGAEFPHLSFFLAKEDLAVGDFVEHEGHWWRAEFIDSNAEVGGAPLVVLGHGSEAPL